MHSDAQHTSTEGTAVTEPSPSERYLGPELVREVADKVFTMLVRDLQIERERSRAGGNRS